MLTLLIIFILAQTRMTELPAATRFDWTQVFNYQDPATVLADRKPDDIVLIATGDVSLARNINARMVKSGDYTFPFAKLGDFLKSGDITWVNLETTILDDCPIRTGGMVFCGVPQTLQGLHSAGVDVVNFANNHAENFGLRGVEETRDILKADGFDITGLSEPVIYEINGKKIGLLGFNDASTVHWVARGRAWVVDAAVRELRPQVDYLIVGMHWGIEYQLQQNIRQQNLGKVAIDAGADMVIGHHPHWVQGVELYEGKPIFYSLGNFIFDQAGGGWLNDGMIAVVIIHGDGSMTVRLLPVILEDASTPRFATQSEAEEILERVASVSGVVDTPPLPVDGQPR